MSHPATILIVDDLASNRETLRELLDTPAYTIIEAVDGPSALRLAAETPPDLVLLDVMMPGMDGFEVCRRLRADPRLAEVPVIIVTALDDQKSRQTGLEVGADDFITKPFNRLELRARVRTIARLNRYRRLHEAQAALIHSENHFNTLFALGPIAIYACDVAGTIQDSNARALAIWGRIPKPGALEDRFCGTFRMYRPDGTPVPHEQSPMAEVCSGRVTAVEDEEFLIERPDGSHVAVIANVAPVKNERGEISCAICTFHDITARKAAELALRENEQWLKAIFNQSPVGVVQTDVTTRRFIRLNQWFCDFLGYTREEMARLSHPEITYPEDLPFDLISLEQLGNGSIREYSRDKRYVRRDGSIVWASVAVSLMRSPRGTATAFITVVLDITARKRLDEHFLRTQKMEALGQFSGGIAHDFNNILTAIGGYAELSQMILKENPEVRKHLASVLKATGRAADLVKQILTFSRQDQQARHFIQLQPVIAESLALMRAIIPSTIAFEAVIGADVPTVLANSGQVHQVLMNLGINAWHAMPDRPGRIQVTLERFAVSMEYAATKPRLRPGEYARLSFSDTGSGMDLETQRRIFEPFFTTKPPGQGSGLGLSVVHGIMDSHDGAVTVHSQPGEGTVFRLYFPGHDAAAARVVTEEAPVPRGGGQRVLVVDDEEELASLMQKALTELGYEVESTTEPQAALALVRADPHRFSLILTDQTMRGMSGLELTRQLREIRPGLPIILMTGYTLSLTAERIEEAGIRQLILKPVTIQLLGSAVHAAVSTKLS